MLNMAEQAQQSALEDAINTRLKRMSQSGYRLVNALIADIDSNMSQRRILDWEGIAVDVPVYTRFALEAVCENFAAMAPEETGEGVRSRTTRGDAADDRSIDMQ